MAGLIDSRGRATAPARGAGGRLLARCIAAAALHLAAAGARADDATVPLDVADNAAPVFTVYTSKDGLSDEIWSTIGVDARGFVWAGSASELARFDGYHWTPWAFPQARSLVRDMQADSDGGLWAVFEREGLARYDGRDWRLQGLASKFIQHFSITRDARGVAELWINHEGGISRLVDGRWQEDPGFLPAGMPVATERTQQLFGGPRLWVAIAKDGLWYRDTRAPVPGPWQRFDAVEVNGLPYTDLLRTVDRGVEELWGLTYGAGVVRIRGDGIRVWRADRGELPTEAMYTARATTTAQGERVLWIATRAGLLRIRGDTITTFDRRHGLPSDAIRGVKVERSIDGIDLLWLATEGGIARAALTDSQWRTVSLLGARENGIFSLLLEPDGRGGERLWVGTAKRGIGLLERGAWRYFTHADGTLPVAGGLRGSWLVPGPDGTRWRLLSFTGGDLLRVDDALRFAPLRVPWTAHPEEAATVVLPRRFDGADELWFGTLRSGAYRLRGSDWTAFGAGTGAGAWSVLGLAEQIDASGRSWLWAASNQGIARYDGSAWQILPGTLGLPVDGYRAVTLIRGEARTELWASSNRHGVVRLDVTDPGAIVLIGGDQVPPPPDPTVYSVLRDSQGRIYVCTNNGIQQLTPQSDGRYQERVFRRRDGLVHDECNTNAQLLDARDRYWAGTLGGLSVFDPAIETASARTEPKPLYFTGVRVDGERREPDAGAVLELPAGVRDLRVDFALLSGLRESESTYRSRLTGFDPTPTAWTDEHTRSFTALPPGSYELFVEARDYAGTAATPRSLALRVHPYWWQRGWVRGALGSLLVLVSLGLVLLYNRGLRLRQRLLTAEVAMRTAELHSANLRLTELSYLDPLTGLANRRRLMEALDASIERAALKRLPVGLIVIDVDHFKAYNDRHGHLAGDAALRAVARALESATREQDLVARFGGEEFACLMLDADLETVARVAERMRALVEALPPRALGNDSQTITLSAGVLSRIPTTGQHADELLHEADAAMYRAKRDGRNCVR